MALLDGKKIKDSWKGFLNESVSYARGIELESLLTISGEIVMGGNVDPCTRMGKDHACNAIHSSIV